MGVKVSILSPDADLKDKIDVNEKLLEKIRKNVERINNPEEKVIAKKKQKKKTKQSEAN